MLDLLLLAVISFLVARVIWNIFGLFQSFFSYLCGKPNINSLQQTTISSSNTNEVQIQPQQTIHIESENNQKSKKQEKSLNSSAPSNQIEQDQRLNNKVVEQKQSLKFEQYTKTRTQSKEELFPVRLQEVVVQQKKSSNNQYQKIIKELKEQISLYQKEKQKYIQTIEEIQQHIVNGTEHENKNFTQDNQSVAIHNLRDQLSAAEHKLQQQKDLLKKIFSQEKQSLIKNYQERIQNIQTDNQQKTKLYETTINEVTQRIHQLEAKGTEQNSQQIYRQQALCKDQSLQYRTQVQRLKNKLQEFRQQNDNLKKKYQEQIKNLTQEFQKSKLELKILKEELSKSQNDYIEYQTKYGAQIDSLQKHNQQIISNLQKNQQKLFTIQQQNEQLKSKLHNQEFSGERINKQLASLEQKLAIQINAKQDLERKLQQTLDQLKFCQQQLNDTKQAEFDLKKKLTAAIESPKKIDRSIKKEDVENSPEYSALKMELQRLKRKLTEKQQIISRNKTPENQQREVSPSFALETKITPKQLTPSPLAEQRKIPQMSPYSRPVSTKSPSQRGISNIFASQYRSNTPAEKQFNPVSTIIQGGIRSEVYLGQTQILNEPQRNIIIHQVSAVKKITVKKTRLMFSLRQKTNKSIHEFILGAPNIILIAELQNKKIIGAFTQNAFSKENKFTKSSIVSKAMIFDVSRQVFITNEGQGEIIRCQENSLIWGNKEFVVNCQEPISISINLNCQNSIYPSNYSTFQFLDSEQNTLRVIKLQIHRVFLG